MTYANTTDRILFLQAEGSYRLRISGQNALADVTSSALIEALADIYNRTAAPADARNQSDHDTTCIFELLFDFLSDSEDPVMMLVYRTGRSPPSFRLLTLPGLVGA